MIGITVLLVAGLLVASYSDVANAGGITAVAPVACTLPGCLTCEEDGSRCKSCGHGRYISNEGKCEYCPYGCLSCVSADICTSCKDGSGFKVTPTASGTHEVTCKRCVDWYCQVCSPNASTCSTCRPNYILGSEGKCELRSCKQYPCAKCDTDPDVCEGCKEGYVLLNDDDNKPKCIRCKAPGCAACPESIDVCTVCKDNYLQCTLQASPAPVCRPCTDQYCASCPSDLAVCDQCMKGYYNTAKCTSCRAEVPNCITCSENGECTKCDPMYKVDNGNCVAKTTHRE